jgi:transposase-like protein
MTIVRLGAVNLQVVTAKNGWGYRDELRRRIQRILLFVVERCFTEMLEAEVTRALGRAPYQRRKQAAFGPSCGRCGRCHYRDRRRFSRNGHYARCLDTAWGRIVIQMPQVRCSCGGAVQIPFQTLIPYQRIWGDVQAQIREGYGQGLSLRQIKAQLDAQLATSVGLRKLNEAVIAIAHLAPRSIAVRSEIPPVVRVDGLWIKLMEATGERRKDALGRWREVKTGVSRPILVAQGVWPELQRSEILAWLLEKDESLESWQHLLEHLFRLGIRPERGVCLLVGDGSSGLRAAWQANWWGVPFQRCIFHKLKNVRRDLVVPTHVSPDQASAYKWGLVRQAARIWQAPAEKDARLQLRQIAAAWQATQPQALATLQRDFELTLTFYGVQSQAHSMGQDWPTKALRTTSPLEREFRNDRRRLRQSVLFHSKRGWLATYTQMQMRKNARRAGVFLDQHQCDLERRLAIS